MAGLIGIDSGVLLVAGIPATFEVAGYVGPIVVTAGYGLFQAANNMTLMTSIGPQQRGIASGMLNLSRNLGLVTGASVMGALFARGGQDRHGAI